MPQIESIRIEGPQLGQLNVVGGRYRLEEIIGRGGMKDVYRGVDVRNDDEYAIARLIHGDGGDAEFRNTIEREVDLCKRVDSPYVARVFELFFERGNAAYIVNELCRGPSLAHRIAERPFSVDEARPVFLAIAQGMWAIHQQKILHRDVKPQNIILRGRRGDQGVAILDFGISAPAIDHKTMVGTLVAIEGTLPYMAREALLGEACDGRLDVYALGLTFVEMLAGSLPFETSTRSALELIDTLRQIERHDLGPIRQLPGMDPALLQLLAAMVATRVEDRPHMEQVCQRLEGLVGGGPVVGAIEGGGPVGGSGPVGGCARAPRPLPGSANPAAGEVTDSVATPSPPPAPANLNLPDTFAIEVPGLEPETVALTEWRLAPIVALQAGERSVVRAFTDEGLVRWQTDLAGDFRRLLACDLDQDGVDEIYAAGPSGLVRLDPRGQVHAGGASDVLFPDRAPTLFPVQSRGAAHLVIDGHAFSPGGRLLDGDVPRFEGNGRRLFRAADGRGLSYYGPAHQGFRGAFRTPAAIMPDPRSTTFRVAVLEAGRRRVQARIALRIYGPGGGRLWQHQVAVADFATGELHAGGSQRPANAAPFAERHAPVAWLRAHEHDEHAENIVVVPLLEPGGPFPSCVVAVSLPPRGREAEAAREIWRLALVGATQTDGAILADVLGRGCPQVVVSAGERLLIIDILTGVILAELPGRGRPIAFGDPFGTGRAHLVLAQAAPSPGGSSAAEGGQGTLRVVATGPTLPGRVTWAGPRGDAWRTGTLRASGQPLGPM